MKGFKFYKQLDQMDCGPACIKMIAKHYGAIYSLEFLRDRSSISNQGVTLYGLSKAAENIGFRTLNARVHLNKLDHLILPFIAHWRKNHFVVVYKITQKHLYVADPAIGKLKYTHEEFLNGWGLQEFHKEGNILILEPAPSFYNDAINKRKKDSILDSLIYLIQYLKPHKKLLIQIFLGLLVGTLIQLILPFLSQAMVDKGINGNNIGLIYLILIGQILLNFGGAFAGYIRSWIFLHIGTKINISIVSDFLIRTLDLPISFFDSRSIGDLLQRIQDNSRIESFLTGSFLNIIFSILNLFIFGGILLFYDKQIFTVFLLGSIIYIIWILVFQNIRKKLDYKIFDLMSRNTNTLVQLFDGVQEIKLSNSEKQKRWEWEKLQAGIYEFKKKMMIVDQTQSSGSLFINEIKNVLVSFLAAKSVIDGEITLGMMVAIQFIIGQANAPVRSFVSFIRSYQLAEISLRRLNEVYSKNTETDKNENYITIMPEKKDISFDNVDFSYSKREESVVLKKISFKIPEGKTTAIVGESGSGKTTLLKLLLKFYFPLNGTITLGGVNFNNVNPQWWNYNCGAVLQDSFIFSDTIAKNITLGDEIINRERLVNCVRMANIQRFIESLPFGYNTKIGKGGHGLSQGQKQRVLIARILYKDPQFVLLDEATNALDSKNEFEIMKNMKQFLVNKTTVIVAHRLSTVVDADNIIVMHEGEIVEQGTHDELIRNRGKYYDLIHRQLQTTTQRNS